MKLTDVSEADGKNCVILMKFLQNGRWELTGKDAETLTQIKQWVAGIAGQMATSLQAPAPPAPAGFKVKAMGPLPAAPATKPKKK